MENLLKGIPQVVVYSDDVLITGKTEFEHIHHLEAVLERLQKAGMRLKKNKCYFLIPEVTYLAR